MFRIPRIRIRWKSTNQHDSNIGNAALSEQLPDRRPVHLLWVFAPWNWRVRVKWVGFGVASNTFPESAVPTPILENVSALSQRQVLVTFDLPKIRVRLSWIGLQARIHPNVLRGSFFVVSLATFALVYLAYVGHANQILVAEKAERLKPVTAEVSLNGETIKITHSRLDMGQAKDLFDHDTVTLIRGLEANPFVLDFAFSTPKSITGLVMDFGGMDFDLRVKVYGAEDNQPILYENEYRNQPPEPHVDLSFDNGPALVTRIYIEIDQFNPPDEPHIHVREVLFEE